MERVERLTYFIRMLKSRGFVTPPVSAVPSEIWVGTLLYEQVREHPLYSAKDKTLDGIPVMVSKKISPGSWAFVYND